MTSATASAQTHPVPNTLRAELDRRRAAKTPVALQLAVEWMVPLCKEVAEIHAQGYGLQLHPSNIERNEHGSFSVSSERAAAPPVTPQDHACLPPETRPGEMGDEHASVYAIGALMYELVTGECVGPNMRRPSELVSGLPRSFEVLLGNALISDAAHRPSDLSALAQALYELAPSGAISAPPPADRKSVSMLALDVDISLSMLPPAPPPSAPRSGASPVQRAPASGGGLNIGVVDARQAPRGDTATALLTTLKEKLEADPSPRYVVVKNGMDHGPFTAVELLQQIGVNTFTEVDELTDQRIGRQAPIGEWDDFAPFAEHAKRHRDIKAEKAAIDHGVARESKQTRGKALLGVAIVAVFLLGAGAWFWQQVGSRSDDVAVKEETVSNIEAEGAVAVNKKKGGAAAGGKRVVGEVGGIPQLAGGMSCEGAQSAYVEEISMKGGQADISRGQYANIMNSGAYFSHCGVPSNVAISICVAVQNGRAVGVTVGTKPSHGSRACIDQAVRRLSFPAHPKLDVVRASFAAE